MKKSLILVSAVVLASCAQAVDLNPSVHFTFDNTLMDSVAGVTAELRNHGGISGLGSPVGSASYVSNVAMPDGSFDTVLSMSQNDFLTISHQIAPNGGGSFVNQYSILMDIKLPVENTWVPFFQTNTSNTNDGDYWLRDSDSLFGVSGDYTGTVFDRNRWNRVIFSVDLTTSTINTYLNGSLARTQTIGGVDGRHSLDPTILILADEDGEVPTSALLANLALYDGAMDANQAGALGTAGAAVPEPGTIALLGLGIATFVRKRKRNWV